MLACHGEGMLISNFPPSIFTLNQPFFLSCMSSLSTLQGRRKSLGQFACQINFKMLARNPLFSFFTSGQVFSAPIPVQYIFLLFFSKRFSHSSWGCCKKGISREMLLLFEDRLPTVCLVFTTRQWFRILRKNVLCINQLNVKSCHFS